MFKDATERVTRDQLKELAGRRSAGRSCARAEAVPASLPSAPDRITRDQLPGYGKPKKKRQRNTRSPLKDLARSAEEAMCEVYPSPTVDVRLTLPIQVVSERNQRDGWAAANKRKKNQQDTIKTAWMAFRLSKHPFQPPYRVAITHLAPRRMDDDNFIGGCKGARDAIAELLGIDDGSDQISFEYAQEVTGKREYAVRIEIGRRA